MNINNSSAVSFGNIYTVVKGATQKQECLMDNIAKRIDYTDIYHKLPKDLDVVLNKGPKGGAYARFLYKDEFVKNDDGKDLNVFLPTDSESTTNNLLKVIQDIVAEKFKMPILEKDRFYEGKTDFFKMFPEFFEACQQASEETGLSFETVVEENREYVWT